MSVAVASSSNLQALEDASQPTSRASSPTSPASTHFQIPRSMVTLNGTLSGTPTSAHPNHALEPPHGVSYSDFLRSWTDAHVHLWLSDIKCGHHSQMFRANDIRGDGAAILTKLWSSLGCPPAEGTEGEPVRTAVSRALAGKHYD